MEKSSKYVGLSILGALGVLFFIGHAIFIMSTTITADTSSKYYSSVTDAAAKAVETTTVFQRHTVFALDVMGIIACVAMFICGEAKRPENKNRVKKAVAAPVAEKTAVKQSKAKAASDDYDDI